jgi:hypothetical protein
MVRAPHLLARALRFLALGAVEQAKSGFPGVLMGRAASPRCSAPICLARTGAAATRWCPAGVRRLAAVVAEVPRLCCRVAPRAWRSLRNPLSDTPDRGSRGAGPSATEHLPDQNSARQNISSVFVRRYELIGYRFVIAILSRNRGISFIMISVSDQYGYFYWIFWLLRYHMIFGRNVTICGIIPGT